MRIYSFNIDGDGWLLAALTIVRLRASNGTCVIRDHKRSEDFVSVCLFFQTNVKNSWKKHIPLEPLELFSSAVSLSALSPFFLDFALLLEAYKKWRQKWCMVCNLLLTNCLKANITLHDLGSLLTYEYQHWFKCYFNKAYQIVCIKWNNTRQYLLIHTFLGYHL